jgi:tRNA U34 2-thiouridine synthase MnmA/TrmU
LEKVLFPLGTLSKVNVRELAILEGLATATKRSSAGICFVGRRDFREFISEYVEMKSGPFVSVENINSHLGTHTGIAAYTHGQRAGISGVPKAFYVVGKDIFKNIVFIAPGSDHPALFTTSAIAGDFDYTKCELQYKTFH